MSTVINSDELSGLMSSVEIDCRLLEDAVELTANVCSSCIVEPVLAVEVVCVWPISEAKLVCVRMDTIESDSVVDDDLMYTEFNDHVVSINDMYIG